VTRVVISPTNVANFPEGGGHFWVYMQYVDGFRRLGCEVYWLEEVRRPDDDAEAERLVDTFTERMARYGLAGRAFLYGRGAASGTDLEYVGREAREVESILGRADLLVNFHYGIDPCVLARFPRTVLVDIDPGLLQFWISSGQILLPAHDVYVTTGETVGTEDATFPDAGLRWVHVRPPVSLDLWRYDFRPASKAFTTVSTWWSDEWVANGTSTYENNKRVSFLEFASLPQRTSQPLELALYLGKGDVADRRRLEDHGWRVRHSVEVASTPEAYAAYVRGSRGEFSCVKPSCLKLRNAWVSDRTLCYLASGKPVVVQDTGQGAFLPTGEGAFLFSTLDEAAEAFAAINADYERHCRAARAIAEEHFDTRRTAETILNAEQGS
jgi:glycosyltransferase involved in cell wall biosynthesis